MVTQIDRRREGGRVMEEKNRWEGVLYVAYANVDELRAKYQDDEWTHTVLVRERQSDAEPHSELVITSAMTRDEAAARLLAAWCVPHVYGHERDGE
jgi:hypothetical protein